MMYVFMVLAVGACILAPPAFVVLYVSWYRTLNFVARRHPGLYERFGGHGIFNYAQRAPMNTRNRNPEFFRFMFGREFDSLGGELAMRCRRGMVIFWVWAWIFGLGILSWMVIAAFYAK